MKRSRSDSVHFMALVRSNASKNLNLYLAKLRLTYWTMTIRKGDPKDQTLVTFWTITIHKAERKQRQNLSTEVEERVFVEVASELRKVLATLSHSGTKEPHAENRSECVRVLSSFGEFGTADE
ncbi:hypothetical protein COOONC_25452 [Cooperia oncophora]